MGKRPEKTEIEFPPETDLRDITRYPRLCLTTVKIEMAQNVRSTWLTFGETQLRPQKENDRNGRWMLQARMSRGVTDFEEDSAYALSLPIVGLGLDTVGVLYHESHFHAWVDPDLSNDWFRVPPPGYNPTKMDGAKMCRKCETHHWMVPHFHPPYNEELHRLVAGRRVEIRIGVAYPGEENDAIDW